MNFYFLGTSEGGKGGVKEKQTKGWESGDFRRKNVP